MQNKYIKYFAAALTTLVSISSLTFAAGDAKTPVFEKNTWQYTIVKSAVQVLKEQQPLIKKEEELKLALKEEEKKQFSLKEFAVSKNQAKSRSLPVLPTQSQMSRVTRFSVDLEDKYNRPGYIEEGKKIASVYSDIKKSLNSNELFRYYHLDKNRFADFSALTPAGIAFVKDVFKSVQDGRQPSVKPYRAELYTSGAVLVYFKDIPGEPLPIMLEFYPQETVVVLIVGNFGRSFEELAMLSKELAI